MTKIIMNGFNGRMGQTICKIANDNGCEIVAGIDIFFDSALLAASGTKFPAFHSFKELEDCDSPIEADVIIDFSTPSAFNDITTYAVKNSLPVVMCTTGLSEMQLAEIEVLSKKVPVFQSANMSLGVNLLIDLVKKAAKFLEGSFDIEIVEKHHNQKLDAPSGTALMIADEINSALETPCDYVYDRQPVRQKRSKTEIGIHAVRGGTIVGDHSVIFAGYNEVIEINHSAMSREVFATGALKAATYIADKKSGKYSMSDMLKD